MPPNTCHYLCRRHSAMLTKLMAAKFESDREPSQQHNLTVSDYSACITAAAAGQIHNIHILHILVKRYRESRC